MPSVFDKEYPRFSKLIRSKYPELPQEWRLINVAGVKELFNQYAVCVEPGLDGVPLSAAYTLFGWRIMEEFWTDIDANFKERFVMMRDIQLPDSFPCQGMSRSHYMLYNPFVKASAIANHLAREAEQDDIARAWQDDNDESDKRAEQEANEMLSKGILPPGCMWPGDKDEKHSANDDQPDYIKARIANTLLTVGIPANIKGYDFLSEAVRMVLERHDIINGITKKLYPVVAERYGTTASKVERAMRHAIGVAWNRGRIEALDEAFGRGVCSLDERPTNGEFIALAAYSLKFGVC